MWDGSWGGSVLTLPPRLAVTLVAQVVECMGAEGMVGTGVGRAGGKDTGTVWSAVGQLAHAGVAADPSTQTPWFRQGLVDVGLAQVAWWRERGGGTQDRLGLDHRLLQ